MTAGNMYFGCLKSILVIIFNFESISYLFQLLVSGYYLDRICAGL